MAKMIKNLSVYTTRANENFHLREDLNFYDDGNYFRGFDYKGLPITTLRTGNDTYCSVRVDYLDNKFVFSEWMETPEYKLADEFNGVSEIDLDKLVENCEKILAKVSELNDRAENEVLDMTPVLQRLDDEAAMINKLLEEARTSVKWWEVDTWSIKYVKEAYDSLEKQIERIADLEYNIRNNTIDKKRARHYLQTVKKWGYVIFREDGYEADRIRKAM